jgi:hypothetical protein
MIRKLATFAAALTLSACATPPPPAPPPPPPIREAPTVPLPPPPPEDSCKSGELQYFVGRNRSEIPVPTDPSKRRVACTTCPVTMDSSPRRRNILFDEESGVLRAVTCG